MRGARKTSLSPLQVAVYERLTSNETLMERVTGITDDVDEGQPLPYITLGETTTVDWGTKTQYGEEITYTLHVWSEHGGQREAKELLSLMLEALSEPLFVEGGFQMDFSRLDMMEVFNDPDGTRHGVLRIRFLISQ